MTEAVNEPGSIGNGEFGDVRALGKKTGAECHGDDGREMTESARTGDPQIPQPP